MESLLWSRKGIAQEKDKHQLNKKVDTHICRLMQRKIDKITMLCRWKNTDKTKTQTKKYIIAVQHTQGDNNE